MNEILKSFIREYYTDKIREYYEGDQNMLMRVFKGNTNAVDERIDLDGLVDALESEVQLAVEELEYNITEEDE